MELTLFELLQGILSSIYVIITFIVAVLLLFKYYKYKDQNLFLVGVALSGIAAPYIPDFLIFTVIISTSYSLSISFYIEVLIALVIITTFISTIAVVCWLFAITNLMSLTWQKLALVLTGLFLGSFISLFIVFIFIDFPLIGTFNGPFDYQWGLLTTFYYLSVILIIIVTGGMFVRETQKSPHRQIKLKGRFLLSAIFSFVLAALIPFVVYNVIVLVITRIILVFSSILFYMGFILPKWVKKLLIRD